MIRKKIHATLDKKQKDKKQIKTETKIMAIEEEEKNENVC